MPRVRRRARQPEDPLDPEVGIRRSTVNHRPTLRGGAVDTSEIEQWDPKVTRQVKSVAAPFIKGWFRPDVRGLDRLPATGAALIVGNHSGGMMTPDVWIFARAFYDRFGFDRPLYTLAHSGILFGPTSRLMMRLGVIHASRENAAVARRFGSSCVGVSRGRLRLLSAYLVCEHHRLQRPHWICRDGVEC